MPTYGLLDLGRSVLNAVWGLRHATMQPPPTEAERPRKTYRCGPSYPYDSTVRTVFDDAEASITGWPSRGGVIVLDPAYACDFEWLGLHPLDPPVERDSDTAAEDEFCQRLLLLGAKWWDSEARYAIVATIKAMVEGYYSPGHRVSGAFVLDNQPEPTMYEKRLIRVGWPSTGGLWVAEFDTAWSVVDEEDNLLEDVETGRLAMVRSMDEKCAMLRDRFQAKFYASLDEYSGYGFLKAWSNKTTGEVGPLLQPAETRELWRSAYYQLS